MFAAAESDLITLTYACKLFASDYSLLYFCAPLLKELVQNVSNSFLLGCRKYMLKDMYFVHIFSKSEQFGRLQE